MFTPEYVRENAARLGIGKIIETSGDITDNVELFIGSDQALILAIQKYASLDPNDVREDIILFPLVNIRKVVITSRS